MKRIASWLFKSSISGFMTEEIPTTGTSLEINSLFSESLRFIKQCLRLILFILILIAYFITMIPMIIPYKIAPNFSRKYLLISIVRFWSNIFRFCMGIKVIKKGDFETENGALVVTNHQSYLDYFVTNTFCRGTFISTVEVQKMPLFGQIAEQAGCLFIDRKSRKNLPNEIENVMKVMDRGISIFIYPEAKATNGLQVIKFRKPFFTAAMALKRDILAITINYKTISGEAINIDTKDRVLWYRNTNFIKHVWNFFGESGVVVECEGKIIKHSEYSKSDQFLADITHEQIAKNFVSLG